MDSIQKEASQQAHFTDPTAGAELHTKIMRAVRRNKHCTILSCAQEGGEGAGGEGSGDVAAAGGQGGGARRGGRPPRGPRSRAPGGGGGGGRGPRLAWRPALNEATGSAVAQFVGRRPSAKCWHLRSLRYQSQLDQLCIGLLGQGTALNIARAMPSTQHMHAWARRPGLCQSFRQGIVEIMEHSKEI